MGENFRLVTKSVLEFFNRELPDVHVTEDALQKPTFDHVKKIYSALLVHSGLKTEKQLLNDAESLSVTDDQFIGGRRTLALNKTMEHFVLNAMQDSSWSLRDLSNPDHRRTLVFIRELIKFSCFVQARYNELEGVFAEKERRDRDELQLKINLGNHVRQSEHKARECDQLRGKKHELYKERDELIRKNGQSRTSKAQIQEHHDSLKIKFDEKVRLKDSLEEQLRELDESNKDLRGKLVKSPDRLHDEIREIEQKNRDRAQIIQDCESSTNKMEQQMQILSTEADRHLECFKDEFKSVKADITTWENAQRSRNQYLMSLDREKSTKAKLESRENELARRFENDLSDLKSKLQRCQNTIDHFHSLTTKHNENITIYSEKVENLQAEYVACQKRLEELKRKLEEHPTDPLKNVISLKKREIEAEILDTEECNDRLKKEITQLDSKIPGFRKYYEDSKELVSHACP